MQQTGVTDSAKNQGADNKGSSTNTGRHDNVYVATGNSLRIPKQSY